MIIREFQDALILDKPAGVATHTPDGGLTPGFLEMASKLLGRPLWAVHRLDRDTSGCLLVATSSPSVEAWTQKLTEGLKKYVFLSPEESTDSVWSFEGRIEKTGNHRFEVVPGPANSFTRFAKLGAHGDYFLYEAEIFSGKTHQIRLHAQACGIPILGDREHGGAPFVRLMLHAQELDLDKVKTICPRPSLFELVKGGKKEAYKFAVSLDRRRFLRNFLEPQTDSLRLVHREWSYGEKAKLCIEKLGPSLQILNYQDRQIPVELAETMQQLSKSKHYFIRQMFNRGQNTQNSSNVDFASASQPETWNIQESAMKFEMRRGHGMSSGIFLDQRDNRSRILHSSNHLRVANFFCYTGGFSVAAALGGATEVVSVDTSKAAIEWARKNFEINNLVPDKYEFFVADSLFFLKACEKRERQFDLIILDPPTFSRSKDSVFKIQDELPQLLDASLRVLSEKGRLLLTMNDESIQAQWLKEQIESALKRSKRASYKVEAVVPPYDFEFPLERETVLKGYWLYFL